MYGSTSLYLATVKLCTSCSQTADRKALSLKLEMKFLSCWGIKKVFFNWFEWTLSPHATYWLASCLSSADAHWSDKNLFDKNQFYYPSVKELPLRLPPLKCTQAHSHHEQNKIQAVTVNLTQCDCLYPCPFHITYFVPCSWVSIVTFFNFVTF